LRSEPYDAQPWHRTLSRLLLPLGVRTFEVSSGPQALSVLEQHPIHLAVVDTRLPAINGINLLQLIQKLGQQSQRAAPEPPVSARFHIEVQFEETQTGVDENGDQQRRIEVRFDATPARSSAGPAVILIAPPVPQQDPQLLQEALKFNAFSVLSEPVDINQALDVMARALKRFHQNQWPS